MLNIQKDQPGGGGLLYRQILEFEIIERRVQREEWTSGCEMVPVPSQCGPLSP